MSFGEAFIDQIKQKLLEEQTRLEEEIENISSKNQNPGSSGVEFPNLGDQEEENAAEVVIYNDNLTLRRELERALRDVKSALDRLEKGKYGICKYCKQPIDERRLIARPVSSACVSCKKMLAQEA